MLEPNQSLKVGGSLVNPDWNWNDVDDLIDKSTANSIRWEVCDSIRIPICDVILSQLQFPTIESVNRNLKNVRT